jgi:hypothetical protein
MVCSTNAKQLRIRAESTYRASMTEVIDEKGRLQLPPTFRPGEVVEVQIADDNRVVISRAPQPNSAEIKFVVLPNGFSVITGLPPIDSEGVAKLLEDFP